MTCGACRRSAVDGKPSRPVPCRPPPPPSGRQVVFDVRPPPLYLLPWQTPTLTLLTLSLSDRPSPSHISLTRGANCKTLSGNANNPLTPLAGHVAVRGWVLADAVTQPRGAVRRCQPFRNLTERPSEEISAWVAPSPPSSSSFLLLYHQSPPVEASHRERRRWHGWGGR